MVLGELGGIAREAAHEEDRVPAEGLELVELVLRHGLEELEVAGRDQAREFYFLGVAEGGVGRDWVVDEDEGGEGPLLRGWEYAPIGSSNDRMSPPTWAHLHHSRLLSRLRELDECPLVPSVVYEFAPRAERFSELALLCLRGRFGVALPVSMLAL